MDWQSAFGLRALFSHTAQTEVREGPYLTTSISHNSISFLRMSQLGLYRYCTFMLTASSFEMQEGEQNSSG